MKKKSRPTSKQTRRQQTQHQRQDAQRTSRQAAQRVEEQLWREMQPRLAASNLNDVDDEEWYKFAADTMIDSAALHDEPEFESFSFDPADAVHVLQNTFDAHVPSPKELEKLSSAERDDILTEAHVRTAAVFVRPDLQRSILDALDRCRQRLRREGRIDRLALAASTEWLLRSDSRPEIWGTCGILLSVLQDSLNDAFAFEDAKNKAVKRAQAIQADVTDVSDLEEGTPADDAFWEAVDKTPGLEDYLDRQWELEEDSSEKRHRLYAELAEELLDPEEIDDFFDALVASLKAHGVDFKEIGDPRQLEQRATQELLLKQVPAVIKTALPPKRFRELMADLDDLIQDGDESDALIETAQVLRKQLANSRSLYWQSPFLAQLYFDAMLALLLEEADDLFDEEDEFEDYDLDEDEEDDA